MTLRETFDVRNESRIRMTAFQVSVTSGASSITNGRKVGLAAMLGVASRAIECWNLRRMMRGAVVASETGVVAGFGGKYSGLPHMANGALFFQNGMGP